MGTTTKEEQMARIVYYGLLAPAWVYYAVATAVTETARRASHPDLRPRLA